MELKVYDWEYFERWKIRYVVFACIVLLFVVLSVISSNFVWWVLILLFAAGYLYFLLKTNKTTVITIWTKVLQVGKIPYQWNELSWFVLEYHTKKRKIHNIVIIDNKKNARIYTIKDSESNLKDFVGELNNHISMLETYEQSTLDKFIRRLKL